MSLSLISLPRAFHIHHYMHIYHYMPSLPIIFLTQYIKYGVIPSGNVYTGPAFVTKENVAQVESFAGQYR